jgi:hypothetical protein
MSTGFLVDLPRRAIAQALVLTLCVVKIYPGANTGPGFGHSRISVKVDLLVFETAPQSLDKDVVHASALAIHADHALNAKTPLRRIAPASSKSGRADALKECASTRTVILYRQGRNYHVGP